MNTPSATEKLTELVRTMMEADATAAADTDLEELGLASPGERDIKLARIAANAAANRYYRAEIESLAPSLLPKSQDMRYSIPAQNSPNVDHIRYFASLAEALAKAEESGEKHINVRDDNPERKWRMITVEQARTELASEQALAEEMAVKYDPASTDEQIMWAKEARKSAEYAAFQTALNADTPEGERLRELDRTERERDGSANTPNVTVNLAHEAEKADLETLRTRARSEADVLETPEDTRSELLHIDDLDLRGREYNYQPGMSEVEEARSRARSAGANVTPEDSLSEILAGEASSTAETDDRLRDNPDADIETAVREHIQKAKEVEQRLNMDGLMDMDNPTGHELRRNEFIVPRAIQAKYVQFDGKFYTKDVKSPRVMIEDMGSKLRTSTTDSQVIEDMVTLAKAKQWTSLKLSGSREFRRETWLQAESQGIKTTGYTPKPADLAALETLRQERATNSIQPVQEQSQNARAPEQAVYEYARSSSDQPVDLKPKLEPQPPLLVNHGEAPFEHKKGNKPSYFVTLESDGGKQHTIWGVDLKRAIEESGALIGERIDVEHLGSQPITLPDGQNVRRNTWQVNLNKNQPQMHVAATNRAPVHLEVLQQNPAFASRTPQELERLAYWRGIAQENNKNEPKPVQDASLTKFDKAAENPDFLKRLDKSEEQAKTMVAQDREKILAMKNAEMSL